MRIIWLTALVLALTACGGPTSAASASPDPDPPVSAAVSAPANHEPSRDPTPRPSRVTPKGNTVKPHAIKWTSAKPSKDGRSLRIVWWSGVEPCTTLDRVEVSEKKHSVTVTLYEGPDRASPNVACIAIAIEKFTDVALSAPLNGRKVIDGAR